MTAANGIWSTIRQLINLVAANYQSRHIILLSFDLCRLTLVLCVFKNALKMRRSQGAAAGLICGFTIGRSRRKLRELDKIYEYLVRMGDLAERRLIIILVAFSILFRLRIKFPSSPAVWSRASRNSKKPRAK